MSMTRKEAIAYFESLLKRFEEMREAETSYWGKVHTETTIEAIRTALTALRGPTREMLERMFPGCEVCKGAKYVTGSVSAVAPYDDQHETETYAEGDFDFCPNCGRPLTDEAVDIELRRWKEAVSE